MKEETSRALIWIFVILSAVLAVSTGVIYFTRQNTLFASDLGIQPPRNTPRVLPSNTIEPSTTPDTAMTRTTSPQIGLNFIRVFTENAARARGNRATPTRQTSPENITDPSWIFDDFAALGAQVYRQITEADLAWQNVEKTNDLWDFAHPDAVLPNTEFEPVVTLFAMQYASGTPPWATQPSEFEPELGDEAKEYLDAVLDQYADHVKYWEIGNEMDHWRAAEPVTEGRAAPGASSLPNYAPTGGYAPQEQGVFLAQAAEYIRAKDPDAIIVLPGMAGLDSYTTDTWLTGVVQGGGTEFFDVMNYHYYGSWENYSVSRTRLTSTLQTLGIADKPVWLTETGVTSDSTLTQRTNYPNSATEQAIDVVRRIVLAYAHGDDLVLWHTHVSSTDEGTSSDWRAYGLRTSTGVQKPSWYTYQLLAKEIIPFTHVSTIEDGSAGAYVYAFTKDDGSQSIIAWGDGTYTPSEPESEMTIMVNDSGTFSFAPVVGSITLSDTPVLIRTQ